MEYFVNGKWREVARIDLRAMPALKGVHNWQNAAMAYGAAQALGLTAPTRSATG